MNNSYARGRRAWTDRDISGYQKLAKLQADLGVVALDLSLDGNRTMEVKLEDILAFLPDVIPALQEVTDCPLAFDSPSLAFHERALEIYDRERSRGAPIVNSIAASRPQLDGMIELVRDTGVRVIVMVSETFSESGSTACRTPEDSLNAARIFVERLTSGGGIPQDHILIDTGLAPVAADTYGLVNLGLDSMERIHADPDLQGVHLTVGLSNFAWGTPKGARVMLEKACLALACEHGLDYVLANPEHISEPLPGDHEIVAALRNALQEGRPQEGEPQEEAGYRQAEAVMEICSAFRN